MPRQPIDDQEPTSRLAAANLAVRYEARYALPIEIEVSGIDRNREVFHERTVTRNVSEWGCAFLLSVELKEDNIISVRVITSDTAELSPERQCLFQVVRVTPEADGWLTGTWKMESKNVWGTNFENQDRSDDGDRASRKEVVARHEEPHRKDSDQ